MTEPDHPHQLSHLAEMKTPFERYLEGGLFASRWLVAPFYVGLVVALGVLVVVFMRELIEALPNVLELTTEGGILLALSLIDLSLSANLVIMVIFAGYENFVSKIDTAGHEDRPSWMGAVDFSGLKIKLIASIVAISAIALLKAFLTIAEGHEAFDRERLMWLVVIHTTFVFSGVLMACMDWLASKTKHH